jgi:L-asparaginase
VEIVVSGAGAKARAVDALVHAGVRGLVVAATGNGSLHVELKEALMRAQASGVRVVKSTRCSQGHRIVGDTGDFTTYPGLSPVKARVSLMLDLIGA